MKITRTIDGTEILEGDALELAEFERNRIKNVPVQYELTSKTTIPYIYVKNPVVSWKPGVFQGCSHSFMIPSNFVCTCLLSCGCKMWGCGSGKITIGGVGSTG